MKERNASSFFVPYYYRDLAFISRKMFHFLFKIHTICLNIAFLFNLNGNYFFFEKITFFCEKDHTIERDLHTVYSALNLKSYHLQILIFDFIYGNIINQPYVLWHTISTAYAWKTLYVSLKTYTSLFLFLGTYMNHRTIVIIHYVYVYLFQIH